MGLYKNLFMGYSVISLNKKTVDYFHIYRNLHNLNSRVSNYCRNTSNFYKKFKFSIFPSFENHLNNYLKTNRCCYATTFASLPKYQACFSIGGIGKGDEISKLGKIYVQTNINENEQLDLKGEDSAFIINSKKYLIFGVADGVGGYRKHGYDPALFSFGLLKLCLFKAKNMLANDEVPSSQTIIQSGYNFLLNLNEKIYGGSTINVGVLDTTSGRLTVSNLGDSKLLLYRPSTGQIAETIEQQHYFNCPFQLSHTPEDSIRKSQSDLPSQCENYSLNVEYGDIIIQGTDGFFDNMFSDDIIKIIKSYPDFTPDKILQCANQLIKQARSFSENEHRDGPFAERSKTEYPGNYYSGGKPDDITLILIYVSKPPDV